MPSERVKYSVIVPVYNRRGEVEELLASLTKQTVGDFEVIIVEDGSSEPSRDICERYAANNRRLDSSSPDGPQGLNVRYFYKDNEGRSIARNYGMERAKGEWLIFFDSDCVIPSDYFEKLDKSISANSLDAFGGPDAADSSFSDVQKAINFAMTSFLTTGGIRGGKVSMEKFTPRTFNMGFRREVFEKVGGFREMFSEDIDMSTRIRLAGFTIGLFPDQYVYHKRRVDFRKFWRQVYVFGMSRITLQLLYPGTMKLVHWLPALFVIGLAAMIVLAILVSPWWLTPIAAYLMAIFVAALVSTSSVKVALLAIPASIIQLCGYGCGFIKAYFLKIILRRGRNEAEEIAIRKGK